MSSFIESVLHLQKLEFDVRLGWLEEERRLPQQVIVEIKLLFIQPPSACQTDTLQDTLCYAHIIDSLKKEFSIKEFKLIEHVSHSIYELIKKNCPSDKVFLGVRVTKKIPIPDFVGLASFSYADERCAW